MSKKVNPIPENYHTVTPYLYLNNASEAIKFYKEVFDAEELYRMEDQGKIGHAELKIGDSIIMLADEYPDMGARSPRTIGGTPLSLMLYVEDVDETVNLAVSQGAKLERPVENKFYGDRSGTIEDPFGHIWHIGTHIEDVSPEELEKRMEKAR
jgi:PhnB protein